jgi:hypothetical protein
MCDVAEYSEGSLCRLPQSRLKNFFQTRQIRKERKTDLDNVFALSIPNICRTGRSRLDIEALDLLRQLCLMKIIELIVCKDKYMFANKICFLCLLPRDRRLA